MDNDVYNENENVLNISTNSVDKNVSDLSKSTNSRPKTTPGA
jgi:hypothetical protein